MNDLIGKVIVVQVFIYTGTTQRRRCIFFNLGKCIHTAPSCQAAGIPTETPRPCSRIPGFDLAIAAVTSAA